MMRQLILMLNIAWSSYARLSLVAQLCIMKHLECKALRAHGVLYSHDLHACAVHVTQLSTNSVSK